MIKIFHYFQYLFFPFFVLTIYFIVKGSLLEYSLDDVSLGVLFMGIAFGFSSLGDMKQISEKEERLFRDKKKFKIIILFFIGIGCLTILATLFFIIQKWIYPEGIGEKYYQLGLNCFPLIIAVFFSLKQLIDKKEYHELKNKKEDFSN